MSDVKFQQNHTLGLPKARELAKKWAEGPAQKMGLSCTHTEGADEDTIAFERSGINGTMKVTGTCFDIDIKLGMMMKAFKPMIEAEISKGFGRMIDKASGTGQA